jgi:NADPH:quinone reductase-like Zn-dependent oxidoreductase/thioesterase domain-containing protein/acyl carrier protein
LVAAACVILKPAALSFEQATTVPIAFMTAWYALHEIGRIRAGQSILIHSATGGVGLAALQIARLAGARIYATAGSTRKRAYLRKLGIRHVMDSRSTAFVSEIRKLTRARGVDLILNSLSGEAIPKGISALAAGGKFLEIGKRDVYANAGIGLRSLRNNISMSVIDMGQVITQQPDVIQSLLQQIGKLIRAGKLRPLLHQSLPISHAAAAFRRMAQAKHMGKLVLTLKDEKIRVKQVLPAGRLMMKARASYLITGGLGGYGLRLAQWLVASGARHLVLCGRSGAATPEARGAVAKLRKSGAKVLLVKADVSERSEVTRLLKLTARRFPPLRGIFHTAMVLDDGSLSQLTAHRFSQVMGPKVSGAWNLHTATAGLKLDYFVMFSSVSALLGAAGQANYAAANCFLDALAHYRRGLGLPALTVNWGALGQAGYLERHSKVADLLAARGIHPIAASQATAMLGRLLQSSATQIAVMRIDWRALGRASSSLPGTPRFSGVAGALVELTSGESVQWRQALELAPPAERMTLVIAGVREATAEVLRNSVGKLELRRPLREIGLDSLMAFELVNRLEQRFGIALPSNNMSANITIHGLAAAVLARTEQDAEAEGTGKVVSGANGAERRQVVGLRATGAGSPLFLIHPPGGSIDVYSDLIKCLPPGCQIYGIRSRVLAGASDEWESTAALARAYAELIGERCPEGALRLAGFSVGGVFALATAKELERCGRTVSWVGLFETPVIVLDPEHSREAVLGDLIAEVHDQLQGEAMLAAPDLPDLADSRSALARRIISNGSEAEQVNAILDWLAVHKVGGSETSHSSLRSFVRQFCRHVTMVRSLDISPVNAPVRLWKAADSRLTSTETSPGLVGRMTRSGFAEEILAGRHFQMMEEPRVSVLAVGLAAALVDTDR